MNSGDARVRLDERRETRHFTFEVVDGLDFKATAVAVQWGAQGFALGPQETQDFVERRSVPEKPVQQDDSIVGHVRGHASVALGAEASAKWFMAWVRISAPMRAE